MLCIYVFAQKRAYPFPFFFGILLISLDVWSQGLGLSTRFPSFDQDDERIEFKEDATGLVRPTLDDIPLVEVEPPSVIPVDPEGQGYKLIPYKSRRPKWGKKYGLSWSNYKPENYQPDQTILTFNEVYISDDTPLIEFDFSFVRNLDFGAIGGIVSGGFYKNDSDEATVESSLDLKIFRVGGIISLDMLFSEPYWVPYIEGGAYMMIYKESLGSIILDGTTQVAPYIAGGFLVQLDWIDRVNSRIAYEDSGIENTFVFLEARKMLGSAAEQDPDFETPVHLRAGLKLEF